jgi:hypothetical protein
LADEALRCAGPVSGGEIWRGPEIPPGGIAVLGD